MKGLHDLACKRNKRNKCDEDDNEGVDEDC